MNKTKIILLAILLIGAVISIANGAYMIRMNQTPDPTLTGLLYLFIAALLLDGAYETITTKDEEDD